MPERSIAEAVDVLKHLVLFTVGVAIYAVSIFNLYRSMARKDIFSRISG